MDELIEQEAGLDLPQPSNNLVRYIRKNFDQAFAGNEQDREECILKMIRLCEAYKKKADSDKLLKNFLNQDSFPRLVKKELEVIKQYRLKGALIFIDLDHFKEVNDQLGHDIGDEVLKITGEVIVQCTRTTDLRGRVESEDCQHNTKLCGRLGGDEMAIFLTGADEQGALVVAQRIQSALSEAVTQNIPQMSWKQTISVGIAGTTETDTVENLKKRADTALYKAKEERNSIVAYQAPSLHKT